MLFIRPASIKSCGHCCPMAKTRTAPITGQGNASRIMTGNTNADTLANAFINSSGTIVFSGMLVKHEPTTSGVTDTGPSCPSTTATCDFDDTVWTLNATKNTCCLGKACQAATRIDQAKSSNTSLRLTTGDINGDGIPDIVYGVPVNNLTSVYVIFGKKKAGRYHRLHYPMRRSMAPTALKSSPEVPEVQPPSLGQRT